MRSNNRSYNPFIRIVNWLFKILTVTLAIQASISSGSQSTASESESSQLDKTPPSGTSYDGLLAQMICDNNGCHPQISATRSSQNPGRFDFNSDSELWNLINGIRVFCTPYASVAESLKVFEEEYVAVCNEMALSIRTNIVYTINPYVLRDIISSKPPLAFQISPDSLVVPKVNKLKEAIQRDLKRVKSLEAAFNRKKGGNNSIVKTRRTVLPEFRKHIKCYQPRIYGTFLNEEAKAHLPNLPGYKKLADGRIYFPANGFNPGYPETWVTPPSRPDKDGLYHYRFTFAANDTPKSKAKAFFADIRQITRNHNSTNGYNQFARTGESQKWMELSSDLEYIPGELLRLCFANFCEFYSKHHDVDDYCDRPSLGLC